MSIARVLVSAPLPDPLDYRIGPEHANLRPGSLCAVPLGRRRVAGIVAGLAEGSEWPVGRLRAVDVVHGAVEPVSTHWLDLTRFASEYYQQPWGELAIAALPPLLRAPPGPRFASALRRLRERGVGPVAGVVAAPPSDVTAAVPVTRVLNEAQRAAVDAIAAQQGFVPWLLHGVTGSGKTEVYLDAIAALLARDAAAQALLLVPEINLTPQLEARVRARFPGEAIVLLHSGLADGDRSAAWLAAHEVRARIVVGTRLAVFASMPGLALLVVDEEHDASYKAGDGARFSARDLAVKRAQLLGVPVVLGSATPSLESWHNAEAGRYRLLTLRERAAASAAPDRAAPGGGLPRVECVDLRLRRADQGLCAPVREALAATLAAGAQSLVFINRRGYAPVISCDACGWVSQCARCSTFAAFHKTDATLRCHHCGWQRAVPRACPTCGNLDLGAVGQGTQRIEETLARLLPGARIARIDRDSTQRRGTGEAAFAAMHAGAVDVLVGTQMVAKGHDFLRVALVIVLNADAQLVAHDFRAPERLFATLMQVAGRAGRMGQDSRVLVQTRYPAHPLFGALARHDYAAFARQQLAERRAAALPPFVAQALLTAEARELRHALDLLARAREGLPDGEVRAYEPVPMPLARKAGVERAQLLLESPSRAALQATLPGWLREVRALEAAARPRVRCALEVDPQEI